MTEEVFRMAGCDQRKRLWKNFEWREFSAWKQTKLNIILGHCLGHSCSVADSKHQNQNLTVFTV